MVRDPGLAEKRRVPQQPPAARRNETTSSCPWRRRALLQVGRNPSSPSTPAPALILPVPGLLITNTTLMPIVSAPVRAAGPGSVRWARVLEHRPPGRPGRPANVGPFRCHSDRFRSSRAAGRRPLPASQATRGKIGGAGVSRGPTDDRGPARDGLRPGGPASASRDPRR